MSKAYELLDVFPMCFEVNMRTRFVLISKTPFPTLCLSAKCKMSHKHLDVYKQQ